MTDATPFKIVLNFAIVCDDCGRQLHTYMEDYRSDQPIKLRAKPCHHCRLKEEEVGQ